MSDERKAIRFNYDAIVDLGASSRRGAYAYAIAKFTYGITPDGLALTEPEPLEHDFRDGTLDPMLRAGTDFWPYKGATDFVVQGSACAPGGRPVEKMMVSVEVGNKRKEVAVFGQRWIEWRHGRPAVAPPEPFVEMPLDYAHAFGGTDFRTPVPDVDDFSLAAMLEFDHPGLYPRNPFGKGYLVEPDEVADVAMPNLEDPADLMTAERLIVRDPRQWYRQPLPWCFDWVHPITFPRFVFFGWGVDAWYPGPDDQRMPEVAMGFLPAGYQSGKWQARSAEEGVHDRFYQGASYGLILPEVKRGTPVVLSGMHADHPTIRFSLPSATPVFEFELDGKRRKALTRLHSVVCFPNDLKMTMLWAAHEPLPRALLPGIHKHIPVVVRINKDEPIVFDSPPLVRDELAAAMAKEDSK